MNRSFTNFPVSLVWIAVLFIVGCSAQPNEEQSLANLRQMTSNGKLPPESVVADIENRFANRKSGALAKLLRAQIRFENKDYAGAAGILASDVFKTHTHIADHALWLRAKALNAAGDHEQAMKVADELLRDYPDSIRKRDAMLAWASSATASGREVEIMRQLVELAAERDAEASLAIAKAHEAARSMPQAINYYRSAYFDGAGTAAGKEAEAKLVSLGQPLTPQTPAERLSYAEGLFKSKNYGQAALAYQSLISAGGTPVTPKIVLNQIVSLVNSGGIVQAQSIVDAATLPAKELEEAHRHLVLAYAKGRNWPKARTAADEMRKKFPAGALTAKTYIDLGLAAREAKNRTEEGYFFNTAAAAFANSPDISIAQFEAGWFQHEQNNLELSSQMFVEHLAKYADKDNTNRGKAGYWAARDSEKSGKIAEACALYEGVIYRYSANWYGYLATSRMSTLKNSGQCRSAAPPNATIERAVKNLKTINIVPETAREKELARAAKSDDLSTIGLFDWAIQELNEAKKTAGNSPKINLALARHHRWKGDNTNALITMMKSYPDYAQMFPEEMDRETWAFFYPQNNWGEIKRWSQARGLDIYKVAGLIRQESVFTPRAASPAKAYGLMQLIMPTAKATAKKYGTAMPSSPEDLYNPALNIELGTAYMKDQLAKYGRIEYMSVAYNAGPGRVPQWRATLPAEMDEFVEAIPFKETKGYVQGIIRNTAQYRRLYDENGNFKPNVGTRPLRSEIDSKPRDQFLAENPEAIIDEGSN
jgi:soluble lytic murein transglycosylase